MRLLDMNINASDRAVTSLSLAYLLTYLPLNQIVNGI